MFGFVSAARLLAQPLGRRAKSGAPKQGRAEVGRAAPIGDIAAREGEKQVRALLVAAPAQNPVALPTPSVRLQMAPQAIEKAQNAPGIGAGFAALPGDEPAPSPAFADALG